MAVVGLDVVTWNVARSWPLGIVTVAGNEAIAALLEDRLTSSDLLLKMY